MSDQAAYNDVCAVILAGGENRRMHGKNKVFLSLGSKTVFEHLFTRFSSHVKAFLLSFNGDHAALNTISIPVIRDRTILPNSHAQGPLMGVASAMHWLEEQPIDYQWLFTMPGDTPFLPASLLRQLLCATKKNTGNAAAAYAWWCHRDHYLTALWHHSSRPVVEKYLKDGKRSVNGLLRELNAIRVDIQAQEQEIETNLLFFNINTPEDYQQAVTTLNKG